MSKQNDIRKKENMVTIPLLLFLLMMFFSNGVLWAEENNMSAGLGLGLWQTAAESDYEGDGIPIDILFDWDIDSDWLKFRVGLNMAKSKLKFDAFEKSWKAICRPTVYMWHIATQWKSFRI